MGRRERRTYQINIVAWWFVSSAPAARPYGYEVASDRIGAFCSKKCQLCPLKSKQEVELMEQ